MSAAAPSPPASRFLVAPLALAAGLVVFGATVPSFLSLGNLANVGTQMWVLALLAVGQMFALASRGFDISVGATAAVSSTVAALSANAFGFPGLLLGVVAGLACGTVNGWLIGRMGLQPIVATLGVLIGARGLSLLMTEDGQVVPLAASDTAAWLAFEPVLLLPIASWAAVLAVFAAAWILDRSTMGRRILMLGSNPEAVHLVGIDPARAHLRAYQLCGTFAGLAGVLMTMRAGAGLPTEGTGMELLAIAAVVIGGTSLSGGVARVSAVLMGAAFIQVLLTGLNLSGVSPFVSQIVVGVVIIASGLVAFALRQISSSTSAINQRRSA